LDKSGLYQSIRSILLSLMVTILCLALILPMAVTTLADDLDETADLVISPSTFATALGDTFTVTVEAQCGTGTIDGVDVYLDFDPAYLAVQSATPGTSLSVVLVPPEYNNSNGTFGFSAGQLSSPFPSGTFILVSITFQAKSITTAPANINFHTTGSRITTVDWKGNNIFDDLTGAAVHIVSGADVDLSVTLQGGSRPDAGWVVPLTVKFFTPGTTTPTDVLAAAPVYSFSLTTTKSGSTAIAQAAGIAPGTYDICVISPHCLTNVKRSVDITSPSTQVNLGTLLEGNTNDDDKINIQDFGLLVGTYSKNSGNTGYNVGADFDRNDSININDFGLLSANYGKNSPIEISSYGGVLKLVRNTGIPFIGAPSDYPSATYTLSLESPVFESLVTCDAQGRIMPSLAESIDVTPDGKLITFHLLKGVKFQDGTDFNAEAVKFNLERCLAEKCAASSSLSLVTSYEIPEYYTLKVNLSQYDARFLLTLAQTAIGQIASPTAIQKSNNPEDHVIGTGPFKLGSWQPDQYIKMIKWDGYRVKGRPYLDGIEIRNNSDLTVSIASLKAGEVNLVDNINPAQYVSLQNEGYAVATPPIGSVFSIIPDSANPNSPFKDIKVRQAIEYAIDKVSMAQEIGLGTQFPSYQLATAPPAGQDPWYITDIPKHEYSPIKAKALLAEAGYPNGFNCNLITDVRSRQDQIVAIQIYLKAVGINTTLDMADVARAATFGKDGFSGILVPGLPTFSSFTQWMTVFNDPVATYPTVHFPPGFKAGWDEAALEVDFDKRMTKMRALMRQAVEEAIQIPYLLDCTHYVTDSTIQGLKWESNGVDGYFDPVNVRLEQR
jgi:peptide/nickel transport system substrate-binding protein